MVYPGTKSFEVVKLIIQASIQGIEADAPNQCCGSGSGSGSGRIRIIWPDPDPEPDPF